MARHCRRNSLFVSFLLFLVFCSIGQFVNGEIIHLTITRGSRKVIDIGAFGFIGAPRSNFTLRIYEFTAFDQDNVVRKDAPGPIGFSLEQRDTINIARMEENVIYKNNTCFADWDRPERILTVLPILKGGWQPRYQQIRNITYPTPAHPNTFDFSTYLAEGFLALFFFNCNDGWKFSFKVEVIEFNLDDDNTVNYLSYGKSKLPMILSLFCAAHFILLGAWVFYCYTRSQFVFKIHLLMGVLVFLKAFSLLFEAYQFQLIKIYGRHKLRADIPTYFFLSMKGIVFFVVILLIGTGWSFIKPLLSEKDKQTFLIVLPLQIVVNCAMIIVETLNEGNKQWGYWRDVLRILDIICCCAVLLPIVWSIRNLREAGSTDGKVARNLHRLKQFRTFYILVVAYIYFTRIVVVLIQSALHWRVTWVAPFILEVGSLIFYLFVGWKFHPRNDNPYLSLEPEDFDDAALRREIEEMKDRP